MAKAEYSWMEGETRPDRLRRALARVVLAFGAQFPEQGWAGDPPGSRWWTPPPPLAMDVKMREALTQLASTWKGDPVVLLAWTVSDAIRLNLPLNVPAPELVRVADPRGLVRAIRRIRWERKGRRHAPDVEGEAMRLLRLALKQAGATWWRDAFKFLTARRRRAELRGACSQIGAAPSTAA